MEDLTHASDMVSAMRTINSLQTMLSTAKAAQGRWEITFEVELVAASRAIKVTARKSDGSGIIKTIPFSDVEYYDNDPDSLVQIVVNDAYENMLKKELTKDLAPTLIRAMRNCMKYK